LDLRVMESSLMSNILIKLWFLPYLNRWGNKI
jgi:hypothetical protein